MTHHEHEERTAGGIVGRVAGKAKELVGELRGKDDLAREGRLQQARSEAGREAAEGEAAELKQEARRTEERADELDPKEKS